jgi:histone H3/H4
MVAAPPPPAPAAPALAQAEAEILIVVSKLKKYIRERSGMNTSDAVADVLSEHVRAICDDAIRTAAADGRKTVLDRDVPRPRR